MELMLKEDPDGDGTGDSGYESFGLDRSYLSKC